MATSDTTLAALLSGSLGSPQQDPALLGLMPKLQLAQAMINEGTSMAPVASSKYGGLGKIAQALLGNYAMSSATDDFQNLAAQRQKEFDAFSGRIGSALGGSSPAAPVPQPSPALTSGGSYASAVNAGEGTGSNPRSTAQGTGQFIDGTWKQFASENPQYFAGMTPEQVMASRFDPVLGPKLGTLATNWLASKNGPVLASSGVQPTGQNLALAHLVGPQAAAAIANADPAMPVPKVLADTLGAEKAQQYVTANPQLGSATAGALRSHYANIPNPDGSSPAAAPAQPAADPMAHYHQLQQLALTAASSYDPRIKAQAPLLSAAAEQEMTRLQNTYRQTPTGAVNALGKPEYMPSPRVFTTVSGDTGSVGPGGQAEIINRNPSGFTGNTPESNAMRAISEIGPKIQAGTATPQEAANYNTAVSVFQNVKPVVTAPTQTVTSVPTRPLPAGMPAQATPGGEAAPATGQSSQAAPVLVAPSVPAIAQQAMAANQGASSGTNLGNSYPRMVKIGAEAAQNLGTIDSAIGQLNAAAAKGLPTGYFGPEWAAGLAAAKNLGIDTSKLGVDPSAVGDIQAGRKSLALVAGGIVRNILGPDSQITEGKLDQFIHATPGIETDPQALQKILGWARSQAVYNKDLASHAMSQASSNGGLLPPAWEAQYYAKNGFGPIYNPLTGEMQQANAPAQSAPAPTHSAADVEAEMRRRGLIK